MRLSVLIPCFNEAAQLPLTVAELVPLLETCCQSYELLFVDDGSTDGSWEILEAASATNPSIKALRLSRNFGKEAALCAGLAEVSGDAVILTDCDLQFPPKHIPEMLNLWQQGYDIVEGFKCERQKESFFSAFAGKSFYSLYRMSTGRNLSNASDYKLLDRKVIDVFHQLGEQDPFFRGLSDWVGFKRCSFTFEVDERKTGVSKWSFVKLLGLFVHAITGFSARPLYLIAIVGVFLELAFGVLGIQTLINWMQGRAASGFTTVILLQLLIGGTILISLGLLGLYIARIFDESKGRPRFIVSERTSDDVDIRRKEL